MSPVLADDHSDEQSRRLYDLAEMAFKYGTSPGDHDAALAHARLILTDPDAADRMAGRVRDNRKAIKEQTKSTDLNGWWWGGDIGVDEDFKEKNFSEIADAVQQEAEFLAMSGASVDNAIKQAVINVTSNLTMVNGWAVMTRGTDLPVTAISVAGQKAIEQYIKKNPDAVAAGGYKPDDFSMRPIGPDMWVLTVGATREGVPRWRDEGVFTNADLYEMAAGDAAVLQTAEGLYHSYSNLRDLKTAGFRYKEEAMYHHKTPPQKAAGDQ